MYGQVIFHRRPGPSTKATEASFRLGFGSRLRLAEKRGVIVGVIVRARHQQWVWTELAKSYRPPTLLEQNPTSG